MEDLARQRNETYAIRDLWRNLNLLSHSTVRDIYDNQPLSAREVSRKYSADPRQVLTSRVCNHSYSRHFRPETTYVRTFRNLEHTSETASAPSSARQHKEEAVIPYHTAITMPPDKRKLRVSFNALNRKLVCRLPHLNDITHFPGYTTRDMKEWEDEVKKVVPSRPKIFLPAQAKIRPLSIIFPPEPEKTRDSACLFRPTVDKKAGKGKEYYINPEWFSERCTPESARARARIIHSPRDT